MRGGSARSDDSPKVVERILVQFSARYSCVSLGSLVVDDRFTPLPLEETLVIVKLDPHCLLWRIRLPSANGARVPVAIMQILSRQLHQHLKGGRLAEMQVGLRTLQAPDISPRQLGLLHPTF